MRSEQHRRNVASLPCARCGLEGYSQCAHANNSAFGKGRGVKSSDLASFPLCADRPGAIGCHTKHDQYVDYSKAEANAKELAWVFETLERLVEMGKLKAAK